MTIGERLKVARAALGLKQSELATKSGCSPSTYQKYEQGPSLPGAEAIAGFVRLGINANWLLTGDGPMMSTPSSSPYAESHVATAIAANDAPSDYVAIPLYNGVRAAAGAGAVVEHEAPDDVLMFKDEWIRFELGARPQDLYLIRVAGDSMEPTLRSGDVILVDRRATRPDREGVYILRMNGMLLVKRLQALPGAQIRVISDNAAFASFQVASVDLGGEELAVVGRVVWTGRRM